MAEEQLHDDAHERHEEELADQNDEHGKLLIAAGFAFDKVVTVAGANGFENNAKTRFYFAMLRSLVMGALKAALLQEPEKRFDASSVTLLVFDELTKHRVSLN